VTRASHAEDESDACIFCEPRGRNADLLLFTGRLCYVILNLYPYNNGHLMVVPNRHIAELAATTADERTELMTLVRHAEMALDEAYRPDGINVGINLGRTAGGQVEDLPHRGITQVVRRQCILRLRDLLRSSPTGHPHRFLGHRLRQSASQNAARNETHDS
jgi:hypothetical protein